jgi:hypothetical protein
MTPSAETAPANLAADLGSNLGDDAPPLPPLAPPGAAPSIDEQLALLTKQMSALVALQAGQMQLFAGAVNGRAVDDEALQAGAAAVEVPATPVDEKRVRIVLEDNDQIPPGGQFAQVEGRPFLLQSGYEMDAPVSLLDVLDHAVMSVPVTDENKNIIGYRDRLRFPYRVVRHTEH